MDENFTVVNDDGNDDEFQELLDGIQLSPVLPGKRGGGRKTTNNTGADVLGPRMLEILRTQHRVDFSKKENIKVNTLFGVIDQNSVARATQISRNVKPSYPQVGAQAVSIAQSTEGEAFLQLWKGTIVNGVLSYQKVYSKSKDYRLQDDKAGRKSFWKIDSEGNYIAFNFNELVDFEVYLNALVEVLEVPVSFPAEEMSKLRNLSEILANVNLNAEVITDSTNNEDDENEDDEVEDEVEAE